MLKSHGKGETLISCDVIFRFYCSSVFSSSEDCQELWKYRYISHWFWTCGLVSHFDLDGPKLNFRPQISPAGGIAISLNFVTSLNSLYISE